MDLAVSNGYGQTITVLLGRGDGTFSEHTTYSSGKNPFFILPADLNNDGKIDLAVRGAPVPILIESNRGSWVGIESNRGVE